MYSAAYVRQRVDVNKAKIKDERIEQLIRLLDVLFQLISAEGDYGIYMCPLPEEGEIRELAIDQIHISFPQIKGMNFAKNDNKFVPWYDIWNLFFEVGYWRTIRNKLRSHGFKADRVDNVGFDNNYSVAISIGWDKE